MRNSVKFLFVCGLLLGALGLSGCATESGSLTWNPFSGSRTGSSSSGSSSGCGPGCNH
ncbi:hypothetical protein ETAA8_17880 [Anatilimnocola aggregata]|uniref:Uncharacterized protein n=1 Tax=Anatilimnocola aggregata TaxID=2528021 RepID=A0A517Y8Y9_9BACT|nr:hypothetical protein [Anatilimnocola aggregata]QDU26707.1 hypothetical protein ETAA8_17880 [Anatilimnocola aggregata]